MNPIETDIKLAPYRQADASLPDEPLIKGGVDTLRASIDFAELWTYRELLYFLTWRDIKVRYKQTAIGAAWAIIQPLFMMIVFTIFFNRFVGVPSDDVPYPVFAYAGLLPWTFFANAVTNASNSLIGNSHLITKVYFPRVLVPSAAVAAGLLDLAIAFVILILLAAFSGVTPTATGVVMLPVLMLLLVLLSLGVGLLLAALTVRHRDLRHALPFVLQLLMFSSPIIYPSSVMPERWRRLLALNPMTGIIENFRAALVGRESDFVTLAVSVAVTLGILGGALYSFRQLEKGFADVL